MNISQYRLAKDIAVSPRRINEIVHGVGSVAADTALRLGRYFNMAPQFWINLRSRYDIMEASSRLETRIKSEVVQM